MVHSRTLQAAHGVKGGTAGSCQEARSGGKLGGRFGARGGKKSKGVNKKSLSHLQCLRLYEVFIAYEMLKEKKSVFGRYPREARSCLKVMCWGIFHEEPKARMREYFI